MATERKEGYRDRDPSHGVSSRELRRHPDKYHIPFPAPKSEGEVGIPSDADEFNRGLVKDSWFLRLIKRHPLATSIGTVGIGGLVAYAAVPGIHRSVDDFVNSRYQDAVVIFRGIETRLFSDPTPDVFDPSKNFSIVTTRNSVGQSSRITTVKPVIEGTKHMLPVPVPFAIRGDMNLKSTREESRLGAGTSGVLDTLKISNIPQGTEIVAPIGGKATLRQTINRDGVQTSVSVSFPDGEGHNRNLILSAGDAQFSIPGATETTDYNYDGTPKVTRRILETNVQPGQPLFIDNSGKLQINVSPGAIDPKTGGAVYVEGKGLPPVYFEVRLLTNGDKAVFINSQ